ncbi:MAG: hypothetical protein WBC99_01415, partial [Candidatus Omnitrophota bacterium]
LNTFDAKTAHAAKNFKGIIGAYGNSRTIVVIDPTTLTHLRNMWSERGKGWTGGQLKMAMLSAKITLLDEFHEPMQSKMSAIIAGLSVSFDAAKTHREKFENAQTLFNALEASGVRFSGTRTMGDADSATGARFFLNQDGRFDMNKQARAQFGKALKGINRNILKRIGAQFNRDGSLASINGMVESVLRGKWMHRVTRGKVEGKVQPYDVRTVKDGGDGRYHPVDLRNGKLQESSTFNDVYMQLGIGLSEAKSKGLTGAKLHQLLADRITVSKTTMSTSLSLSLATMFDHVCGASGTIQGLGGLTMAKIGTSSVNLSAVDVEQAIRAKLGQKGLDGEMADVFATAMTGKAGAKAYESCIKRARAASLAGEVVIIADPFLSQRQIDSVKKALSADGITVNEIGAMTTDALSKAKGLGRDAKGRGGVIIMNTAGFTGLDFCGNTYKSHVKRWGKALRQRMIIMNAESIPADRMSQLLGRVARHGEKVKFDIAYDKKRMGGMAREMSDRQVMGHLGKQGIIGSGISTVQRAFRTFVNNIRGKKAGTQGMSLTDSLILTSTYQQKLEISEALTFSIRDSLRNDMVIGFLKSFSEMPNITEAERLSVRAELDRVLETDTGTVVSFGREISGDKGVGSAVVVNTVKDCMRQADQSLRMLRGKISSSAGLKMMANQRGSMGELGTVDRRGRVSFKNWEGIRATTDQSLVSREVRGNYRATAGVLKALAGEVMPSAAIGRAVPLGEAVSSKVETAQGSGSYGKAKVQAWSDGSCTITGLKAKGALAGAKVNRVVVGAGAIYVHMQDNKGNVQRLEFQADEVPGVLSYATEGTSFTATSREEKGKMSIQFSRTEVDGNTSIGSAVASRASAPFTLGDLRAGVGGLLTSQ